MSRGTLKTTVVKRRKVQLRTGMKEQFPCRRDAVYRLKAMSQHPLRKSGAYKRRVARNLKIHSPPPHDEINTGYTQDDRTSDMRIRQKDPLENCSDKTAANSCTCKNLSIISDQLYADHETASSIYLLRIRHRLLQNSPSRQSGARIVSTKL